MGIDYRTQLIVGWRITIKDLDDELVEALLDKEYLHIIDPWDEKDDYILGIELYHLNNDENECIDLGSGLISLSEEQRDDVVDLWSRVYPDKYCLPISYYLLGGCF